MAPDTQQYTIAQTGDVLGANAVTTEQNQVTPDQRETPIISFECPENYSQIEFVGARDPTRFKPRAMEVFDGDGATTTFGLSADLVPVAGETELAEQPYPVAVAVEVGTGEVAIADVDYATDEITLESAPADGTDNVKIYPIVTDGTIKFRGENNLGQDEGVVFKHDFPIYRFHDLPQDKRGTEFNLSGRATWDRHETLIVTMDSAQQIVWDDSDFPESYVSTFEQDVQITA